MASMQKETFDTKLLDTEKLDFSQYIQTIRQYMWRVISLAILISILVTLIVLSVTPMYKSSASLLIEAEQANVLSIEEIYGMDSSRKEYFQTQYEILRSRQVAEKVVNKLRLYDHPLFDPNAKIHSPSAFRIALESTKSFFREALPFLPQKEVVEKTEAEMAELKFAFATKKVMASLSITPVRNTQVVVISYESEDRELAALIANTFGDVYIENYLEAKLNMTTKATTWLNESLQGLRTKLDIAETNLSNFYEQEQLVDLDGVVGLTGDKLQLQSEQLLAAQNVLAQSEAIFTRVNNNSTSQEELADLPEVLNHPSIQSVKKSEVEAQSRVSELSKTYGPKHPRMITATAELESLQLSLSNQIRSLVSGINSEYRSAKSKVETLSKEVESTKQEFRKLSNLENRRKALQREVDINQQLYNSFFTRLKETSEIGGFESANARILDMAVPAKLPFKPKKAMIIAAAFAISLVVGVMLALSLEALNSGIRSVDDVERRLGQRLLGIIPWQPHSKMKNLPLRHFFDTKHHMFGESVRTLRTSLQLLNIDKPNKTILVTSSVPKEGKSTVSINLAFALGQLNKVLLIDTDLRRPTLGKQFGFPGFQPGVANLIAGTHELEECIVTDEYSGIDLICAGTTPPNPQELLASQAFKDLIAGLKDSYDHIIVDSAPTQAVSDAIVVSKECESVVYVVRADSTSHKVINNGLSRFLEIGHRVDGVVLNQVDIKKAQKTGEYSGFYDQYGYQSYSAEAKSS